MHYKTGELIRIFDRVAGGLEDDSIVIGIFPHGFPADSGGPELEQLAPGIMVIPGPVYLDEHLILNDESVAFVSRGADASVPAMTDDHGGEYTRS